MTPKTPRFSSVLKRNLSSLSDGCSSFSSRYLVFIRHFFSAISNAPITFKSVYVALWVIIFRPAILPNPLPTDETSGASCYPIAISIGSFQTINHPYSLRIVLVRITALWNKLPAEHFPDHLQS